MSDVKQQPDQRAITVIGVLCSVRAIESESQWKGGVSPASTSSVGRGGPALISMHAFTGLVKPVNALHFIY